MFFFFFSSRRRHTRLQGDWSSDVCSSDLLAAMPLFALLIAGYFFVLTPVTNTYIRTQEYEADIFGLNAAGQPDGEAVVDLKVGGYCKLEHRAGDGCNVFDTPSCPTRNYAGQRGQVGHPDRAAHRATPQRR